jgi:hypothetical protein
LNNDVVKHCLDKKILTKRQAKKFKKEIENIQQRKARSLGENITKEREKEEQQKKKSSNPKPRKTQTPNEKFRIKIEKARRDHNDYMKNPKITPEEFTIPKNPEDIQKKLKEFKKNEESLLEELRSQLLEAEKEEKCGKREKYDRNCTGCYRYLWVYYLWEKLKKLHNNTNIEEVLKENPIMVNGKKKGAKFLNKLCILKKIFKDKRFKWILDSGISGSYLYCLSFDDTLKPVCEEIHKAEEAVSVPATNSSVPASPPASRKRKRADGDSSSSME